jgi:tetratricopeptide (TPR) repeat protein
LGWTEARYVDVAFAATLLFAIHPVSGSPVNYIAGRDILLMLMFLAACLLVYVRMRRLGDTFHGWFAVLLLYSLALLSKQNAVMVFAVILVFEILLARSRLGDWRLWARVCSFLPGVVGILFMELASAGAFRMDNVAALPFGLAYPLTMASAHLFYYLRNFLWPFEMRALAQFDVVGSVFDLAAIAGCCVILLSLFLAWYLRRRSPLASFSILAYWILFVPTSSFFPLEYIVTDYRQYPSLPFLSLLLVLAMCALSRHRLQSAGVAALALYFAVSSYSLNKAWRTEESFWAQSIRYGARELAHMNYALSIQHNKPELAEYHFRETLRTYPQHIYGNINLGLFYIRRGQREKGLALVEKAVRLSPHWALSHYWLAKAYSTLGRQGEAVHELARAADLDPRHMVYQYEAARALQVAGRVANSLPYLRRIQAIDPYFRDTLFLAGWEHQVAGRAPEAIAAYRSHLQRHPAHAKTHFNLGFALMESGDCGKAIVHFREALARDAARKAAHLHLARCYTQLGDDNLAKRHRAAFDYP